MALAFLRRHQRWFHILLGIVIIVFIFFFGPQSMFNDPTAASAGREEVGRVGDLPISAREYEQAQRQLREEYERMYASSGRGGLDLRMLRMLGIDIDRMAFDRLVDQRLIELEARRLGLAVSDRDLAQMVATHPAFQVDGRFVGAAAVRERVQGMSMTLEDFEALLRRDLLSRQLQALVTDGITVAPAEVEEQYRRINETIKAEYVMVDGAPLRAQLTASDDEARAHYEANKESYRVPEKRVAAYVLIDPRALREQVPVTETDVTSRYEGAREQYREKDQVCARQIVVYVKEGRTEEQAKKLAEDLLKQVRGGADFAALAKKSSDDTGTAARGGEMDCFERGAYPNEVENVIFSGKDGDITEPIRTQYGYHVVHVKSVRPERQKPLEEVKEQIKAELTASRAQAEADRLRALMAGSVSAGKKKLEEAAQAHGLKVATSEPMARGERAQPFDEEAVRRLFELKPGETLAEPLSAGDGYLFVSLVEAKASRIPELAEVQERAKADVVERKGLELARARAAELKAKAASMGLAKAAATMGLKRGETASPVSRDTPVGELPTGVSLEEAAFTLPVGQLSDPIPVKGGYVVLRVTEHKEADPAEFEKQKGSIAARLRATKRNQMFRAFMAQARQRFPIEQRPEALGRRAG